MKVSELKSISELALIQTKFEDKEISTVYTSDLLSDVMGHADENCVLITIQGHKNTIAVATLVGAAAVIICNNIEIEEEMLTAAKSEKIAIFKTDLNQYQASILLSKHI